MNRRVLVFAVLAVVMVAVPVVSKLTRGDDAKEVELTTVTPKVIRSSILASGSLAYREQVQLRSEVIGKAKAVPVAEGDAVEAGDVIIRLDPEQFRSQVEQQEANVKLQEIAIRRQELVLDNLRRQVRRKREMFERGLLDDDSFEQAENQLALAEVDLESRREQLSQARAGLAQAQDNLTKTEIRSPIDGIIIQLDVKPGEAVIAGTTNIPGSTLAVVADPASMFTEVQVDEADIAKVSVGQEADIYAAAFPDLPLPGVVESIAASARQASGQQGLSFEVKIRLTEPDKAAVRPGMSCRAEIYTRSSDDALAVPVQAVLYDDDVAEGEDAQAYVFISEGGKAVRRDVSLGLSSDTHQEISEGLEPGEEVVTGPFRTLRSLRDGDAITAKERSETAPEEDG